MSALDSELDRVLGRIPELSVADAVVTPIAGGMTNRNFRVRTADGDYVVRLGVKETGQLGIDRDNEDHNSRLAAAAGVGAAVVARLHDPEALVVEFVSGTTLAPEDFRDPRVAVLARLLRTLHGAPAFSRDFDMVEVQRRYHRIVVEHGYPLPDEYARYEERARAVGEILTRTRTRTAPCHNDLMPGNFIESAGPGSQIWLVDYEYSGNNDPCYDLGDAINELELDAALAERLVTAYHDGPRPRELARARLWSLMSKYGWTLWGSIRIGTTGDPVIREWAQVLWSRAVDEFESPEFDQLVERAARPEGV